jgi:hypothetical protein
VVADRVVVGWVLVVVGSVLVVVGPVVVGSALVVVSRVVVDSTLEVETAVVVGAVMVGSGAVLGVVTEDWVVASRAEGVLLAVVSLGSRASAGGRRPAGVIGRLTAEGLISGLLVGGEGAVVGCCVVVVVKDVEVEVGAGLVVTVGSATPGARCGDGGWRGNKVAEATRAARTAVVSPKATSSSLQGRRGLARCRGGGVGMCIVPVRLFLRAKGVPGGGAATGHIGRSRADWIERCVRPTSTHAPSHPISPVRVTLDQGSRPWLQVGDRSWPLARA